MAIETREHYDNDLPQVTAASTKAFNITWQNFCLFWQKDFMKASRRMRREKEKADFFILLFFIRTERRTRYKLAVAVINQATRSPLVMYQLLLECTSINTQTEITVLLQCMLF